MNTYSREIKKIRRLLDEADAVLIGAGAGMNVPGRADGNWLFRTTEDTINQVDTEYYKHINRLFKRK